MAIAIGPNFANELAAAGLLGSPLTWGPDGALGNESLLTAGQRTTLASVLAAHDPTKQTQQQILANKLAAGYVDTALGVTLAIDETSQQRITSVGAAAGIAVATNTATGKTFIFPTPGAPYTAPSAQAAYDLSERCREYVQGLIVAAEAGTLTP